MQPFLSTLFRRFQDYYNKRLKVLYDNGNKGTKRQAHHVSGKWENKFKEMEAKLYRTSNNVEQLHENQGELESAYHVGFSADTISRVPSAITRGDRAPHSTETVEKMMVGGLALAIKELRRELGPTSNRTKQTPDDTTKVWKKWKYWCYSCGTNVSHNSRGHTRNKKDRAHEDNLDATKDKPKGGNSTKDKYWMKWCNPVTYRAHDNPE